MLLLSGEADISRPVGDNMLSGDSLPLTGDKSPFLTATSFTGSSESERLPGLRLMLRVGLRETFFLHGLVLGFLRGLTALLGLWLS